jgi:hypothetical protein
MSESKTTACAPFWSAVRRGRFCAAWPARLQETVQIELIAVTVRRITDRHCGSLFNFPMWV